MIVFSAICPHPPLLIPEIGKENLGFVQKTSKAMERLSQDIKAARPDTIVIISPHGQTLSDAFAFNISPDFSITFKDFGDLATNIQLKGDIGHAHHYKEILEAKMPVVLITQQELDHGVGVPLYFLTKKLDKSKLQIVPTSYSLLDYQTHFEFGRKLQEDMLNDTKRIAVIASGDLSHRLSPDAPAGFSNWAKKFDETLIKHLRENNVKDILGLDHDFVEEAAECGLRSIIILLGVINSMRYKTDIYSYEGPFGVGYAVVNFKLAN